MKIVATVVALALFSFSSTDAAFRGAASSASSTNNNSRAVQDDPCAVTTNNIDKACKKTMNGIMGVKCKWSKKDAQCILGKTCGATRNGKNCRKMKNCKWNGGKNGTRTCSDKPACATATNKKDCKAIHCSWKGKHQVCTKRKKKKKKKVSRRCGCSTCTKEVLASNAEGYSCGSRIEWVLRTRDGSSEAAACVLVAEEYPNICGRCHTTQCGGENSALPIPPVVVVVSEEEEGRGGGTTTVLPIPPVVVVSEEEEGRGGGTTTALPIPPVIVVSEEEEEGRGGGTTTVKVMSYNTEYTGYADGRVPFFAAKIADVQADVVGVQECQDAKALAAQSGYTVLPVTGRQNYILYNSNRVQYLDSGTMDIPRDNYAPRTVTFGKFRTTTGSGAGNEFWFFNTHLPHRHNQAADPNTHAMIGRMVLAKRKELGAGSTPIIVVGDCNPFASAGASEGSFESNLANGGIVKLYQATGSTGGYSGLDKIFVSRGDWIGDGADVGTGRSDHPAIFADLILIS